MKKFISLLLFVYCYTMIGHGQEKYKDAQYNLEYTINSQGEATITNYYGGEATSIIVPYSVEKGPIKYISKLLGPTTESQSKKIDEIIIKAIIKSNKGTIVYNNHYVRTIVFADSFTKGSSTPTPFLFYSTTDHLCLDNIIFLNSCNLSISDLIDQEGAKYVVKPGEITICFTDGTSKKVQMFLYNKNEVQRRNFGANRFEDILNALIKNDINIMKISDIDLSTMALPNIPINFNFTDYNPAEKLAPGATVKISDDLTYQNSSEYTLSDLVNYSGIDTEAEITYTRNDTKGWNSFCLPFDVAETNFNESVEIYEFAAGTESSLRLKRVANGQTIVAKGTPFLVKTEERSLTLKATATLSSTTTAQDITHDSWCLHGSFEEKPIRANTYKILEDGSAFGITNERAYTYPYRCYLEYIGNQAAPERLSTIIDEETKIEVIHSGNSTEHVRLYDLMGRPRKAGQPGLFVR